MKRQHFPIPIRPNPLHWCPMIFVMAYGTWVVMVHSLKKAVHTYTYLISTEPLFLAKELRESRKHWNHVTCIFLFILKTISSESSSQQRLQVYREKTMHGICNATIKVPISIENVPKLYLVSLYSSRQYCNSKQHGSTS